jgi:putative transposase
LDRQIINVQVSQLLSPIGRGNTPALRRQLEQIVGRLGRMSDYRHGSHTTFSIHLHVVWITKSRHKGWRGEVAERVRAIVRDECQKARVAILPGPISPDPVHGLLAIPPHVTSRRLSQRMKGTSSYRLLAEFPHLRKRFGGRHVWARGSFCRRSGNVTDEVIQAYIAQQWHDSDDVFRIEGEASPSGDPPLGESSGEGPPPRLAPA